VAITPARYRTLVVNEMFTAGLLPPNGRATELGSFTALRPKLNKWALATTVFNLGRIRVWVLTASA